MSTKQCIACKFFHHKPGLYVSEDFSKCLRPNPHTGIPINKFVEFERMKSVYGVDSCGLEGKFFVLAEPKVEPPKLSLFDKLVRFFKEM